MKLSDLRKKYKLTQKQAADILKIPLRTYIRYEKDEHYGNAVKRETLIKILTDNCQITETKGILQIKDIKDTLTSLFESEYKDQIEFCYLFGSYAKGYPKEDSDIDLCVACDLKGLQFVCLNEDIKEVLFKNIDLIRFSNLKNNFELLKEILKDGIKIF